MFLVGFYVVVWGVVFEWGYVVVFFVVEVDVVCCLCSCFFGIEDDLLGEFFVLFVGVVVFDVVYVYYFDYCWDIVLVVVDCDCY